MMLVLRITVALLALAISGYIVHLISSGRLLLRYALLWFVFALLAVLAALFPGPVFALAYSLGFQTASNFVLFVGLFFVLAIALSLTVAVSRLVRNMTRLVQENALLRSRVESLEGTAGAPEPAEDLSQAADGSLAQAQATAAIHVPEQSKEVDEG